MVFFTTLAGAGQGVLIALYGAQLAAALGAISALPVAFLPAGAVLVLLLCGAGLVAATFHLGRPLRAWRAIAAWRTSWLSREIIVLPVFMAAVASWGLALRLGAPSLAIGAFATALALVLYLCTGMIYGAVRAIGEWATPLTPLNFAVQGVAAGLTLATALAAFAMPSLADPMAACASTATALAVVTRGAQWWRNESLQPATTLQSAIGVRHPCIVATPGMVAGSFNSHEFFHGRSVRFVRNVRAAGVLLGFLLPLAALALAGDRLGAAGLVALGLAQLAGLAAERWVFFADARHPQNRYAPPPGAAIQRRPEAD
jgi:DMSO reductase anchor subunit